MILVRSLIYLVWGSSSCLFHKEKLDRTVVSSL